MSAQSVGEGSSDGRQRDRGWPVGLVRRGGGEVRRREEGGVGQRGSSNPNEDCD